MALNKEPILKRCRYLGISPMVMGVAKESKRFTKAGANNRKKLSEYGMQLKEKQKLKFIYGVMEDPFRKYFEIASKMEGKTGDNLITILESRLDNVVYRMGMSLTRREARQLVTHRHFTVNGKRINIPSYRLKVGDVIALHDGCRSSTKFKDVLEQTASRAVPMWLEPNKAEFSAKVVRMPSIEDIDYETETRLVVELYSK